MFGDDVEARGVAQDYAEAVKWYRLAAEQGHAIAQFNQGLMYYNGDGVIHDNIYAQTVLDQHFDDITTQPIEGHASYSGKSLMEQGNTKVTPRTVTKFPNDFGKI